MKVEMNNANGVYAQKEVAVKSKPEKVEVEQIKEPPKNNSTEKGSDVKKEVKKVVDKMNSELKARDNTAIEFKIHESDAGGLNKISIKVIEKDSEKVIVEIPSEEAIEFSEKMDEITGMLFDHSR